MKPNVNERGAALIMSLLVMTVLGVVVMGSLKLSGTDRQISSNDAASVQAHAAAQAAIAYWKTELVTAFLFMRDHPERYQQMLTASPSLTTCGNFMSVGVDLHRDYPNSPLVTPGSLLPPTFQVTMNGVTGRADVTFDVQGATVTLHAKSAFGRARATVTEAFSLNTLDLWNHALFAERLLSPTTLHGRVDIRGSVHLNGTDLGPNDIAFNPGGDFLLGNTYHDLPANLQGALPAMRLSVPEPADLCATLRVRSGHMQLSGSSALGQPGTRRSIRTDHLHGIFTNHGIRGGTEGSNVHALNGIASPYEPGGVVTFPRLDTLNSQGETHRDALEQNALVLSGIPYNPHQPTDPANPQADDRTRLPIVSSSGGTVSIISNPTGIPLDRPGLYYLSAECSGALFGVAPDGMTADGTAFAPTFRLEPGMTESFACRKYRMSNSTPNPQRDQLVVEVIWSRTVGSQQASSQAFSSGVTSVPFGANELYVGGTGGVVLFLGRDLVMTGGHVPGTAITYRGAGVLFAEKSQRSDDGAGGSIQLGVDILPTDGQALRRHGSGHIDATALGLPSTFPATSLLHLVARDSIETSGAQHRYALVMYAQESVRITLQTVIAGSIVTRVLDAQQIPSILQVANLGQYVSSRMPGSGNTTVVVSRESGMRR